MQTVREVYTYSFDELSEEAKQTALENMADINVDYDWWEFTYEDAENIGIKITSFDIYRWNITGELLWDYREIIRAIETQHGKKCDTWDVIRSYYRHQHDKRHHKTWEEFNQKEFLRDLLEDYLVMLSREYDYLTSEKAIIETIASNEYQFTSDGHLF